MFPQSGDPLNITMALIGIVYIVVRKKDPDHPQLLKQLPFVWHSLVDMSVRQLNVMAKT
jgi:hypothetical protein